jgi:hypothetical protein
LSERFGRFLIRLDLMPAQHLHNPVVGVQIEPEAFRFPPLPCSAGAFAPGFLAAGPPALGGFGPGWDISPMDRRHQD